MNDDNRTCNYDGLLFFGTSSGQIQLMYNETNTHIISGFDRGRVYDVDYDYEMKNIFYSDVSSGVASDIGYVHLPTRVKRIIYSKSVEIL